MKETITKKELYDTFFKSYIEIMFNAGVHQINHEHLNWALAGYAKCLKTFSRYGLIDMNEYEECLIDNLEEVEEYIKEKIEDLPKIKEKLYAIHKKRASWNNKQ